jgi:hypothetical protein
MVNRDYKIEVSVSAYARVKLDDVGYDSGRLVFMEEFPYDKFDGNIESCNYCAFGFNFDDQGKQAELGSSLKRRIHTLEFFVFGVDELNAKSIANELKRAVDVDERIPLLDVGEENPEVIDQLLVVGASSQKVVVNDPKPHERHVWLTTVRIEDEYDATAP